VSFITLIVIMGVSSTIILFSVVYMFGDPRLYEFLLLLAIFVSSMLMLVSAGSYM
jgi:NADH:ubiquinone oxidoreductase subunit 5 (subunit L)/multisubunit Na+/H+ antiporter MnhA subunit